jgi:hypothetical protein
MFEFTEIFESEVTTHAFIIGSFFFIALCGVSFVSMQKWSPLKEARRATQMQIASTFVIAAAFLAAGVGIGANAMMSHSTAAAIAAPMAAFSIEELHRQIDMKALPVLEIKDFM